MKRGGIDSARCMEVHPKSCLRRQCDREKSTKGDSDDVSFFRAYEKTHTTSSCDTITRSNAALTDARISGSAPVGSYIASSIFSMFRFKSLVVASLPVRKT